MNDSRVLEFDLFLEIFNEREHLKDKESSENERIDFYLLCSIFMFILTFCISLPFICWCYLFIRDLQYFGENHRILPM